MKVAVVGGYGDVGSHAVRALLPLGCAEIRIGGRSRDAATRFAQELNTPLVKTGVVDFRSDESLEQFAAGSQIVLNCAGPSHVIADRVARAALRADAHYVDAAGDDHLFGLLDSAQWQSAGRAAILSAGLQPGLTALLPRWLAQREFESVHCLASYLGVMDVFTEVAADDFLHAAVSGVSESLAAWRGGHRSGALRRRSAAGLPFFSSEATLLPALNTEGSRLARVLRLTHGDWYSVLAGRHVLAMFGRALGVERAEAAAQLRRASRLDLLGAEPSVMLLLQLDGARGGQATTRTLFMRGRRSAELSGALAALSVLAVSLGEVPVGCHFAGEVLDPALTVGRLREMSALTAFELMSSPIEALGHAEQGTL